MEIDERIKINLERFEKISGYKCNLENPKTFLEKITRKKIYDRNPLIALTADKLKVRDFVINIIGKSFKKHLAIILFTKDKFEYDFLPDLKSIYVLKPNNASGRLMAIFPGSVIGNRKERIYKKIKSWFDNPYGMKKLEWGYQDIRPVVYGEKLIYENDILPLCFKIYTFSGKVKHISIYKYEPEFKKRFIVDSITSYNRDFKMLNIKWNERLIGNVELSSFTEQMISISEKLCKNNFDFCRVDFLVNDSNFFLSELTHYPVSGASMIVPSEFDIELGEMWEKQEY